MTDEKERAELTRFFEKDIIEFLDEKLAQKGAQTMINEIYELVKKQDFDGAAKLLEKAVEEFNKTDSQSAYREIYFNKILDILRAAKKVTKEIKRKNKLTDNITLLENSGQLKQEHTQKITVFMERDKQLEQEEREKLDKELEKAQKIQDKMAKINKELFVSIRKKDLKTAILQYKELKKNFQEYPNIFKEQKKELYNDLIAFFMRIQKLKESIITQNEKGSNDEKFDLPKEQYLTLEQVKIPINEIKNHINQKEYKQAKNKTIQLKHKISLIPNEYSNVKTKLELIANKLLQKIEFAKSTTP